MNLDEFIRKNRASQELSDTWRGLNWISYATLPSLPVFRISIV